jgi:homoserine O-succinyltransferase
MPLILDTAPRGPTAGPPAHEDLTVGLVNNMPDTAWEATERQFLGLLRAAARDVVIRVKLFSIGDVPRGAEARAALSERYRDISELWAEPLDGLIVTGTEPRATLLGEEPYWPTLSKLVAWAQEQTASTIWSCLAAHAAVLHDDGIERRPLKEKRFGVFDFDVAAPHPLMIGAAARLRVPHSRCNDLPERELASCGYSILTRSAAAGVDTFVRQRPGAALFVFFQGHPEYEASTLAREYRRDVGRFLRGERESFPAIPEGYFDDRAAAQAEAFRARAVRDRHPSLFFEFPMSALEAGLDSAWRRPAVGLYQNWIAYLKGRRGERRALRGPLPRAAATLGGATRRPSTAAAPPRSVVDKAAAPP